MVERSGIETLDLRVEGTPFRANIGSDFELDLDHLSEGPAPFYP